MPNQEKGSHEDHEIPTIIRTEHREYRVNSSKLKKIGEFVQIGDEEKNLLLFFMGPHAVYKLNPEQYLMYNLMWKYWGAIDRKTIFRLTGVSASEASDRDRINSNLARSIGSSLTDLVCGVEFYLGTWSSKSVKPITKNCHVRMSSWIPRAYKVASRLMSNGLMSKHKNFRDAIAAVSEACDFIYPLYDEQIQLFSTVNNKDRRDWLNDIRRQVKVLSTNMKGLVGRDVTSSLYFR